MQVTKSYSGTITPGSTSNRQISYGNTATASHYANKTDFFNQAIADFLRGECGVDAAYEARESSTEKFLWIYGVPFLFLIATYAYVPYGPYNGTAIQSTGTANTPVFLSASSGDYSFSLVFTGNPKTAFALRIKNRNGALNNTYDFRFMKATNVATGGKATLWLYGNSVTATAFTTQNLNGIDLNADGTMKESSFSTDTINFCVGIFSKAVNKAESPRKFPLVPVMAGIWQIPGVYCHLVGYGLPAALGADVENQTEVDIAGRRFIVTSLDAFAAGYLNMGLIEV